MSLKIIRSPEELKTTLRQLKRLSPEKTIGFVPTMGALHEGHKTLLESARAENDICILSIFVNPTQFNDKEDLKKYPKTWDADLALADHVGVDIAFAPEYSEMYPDNYRYQLNEKEFSQQLCGKDRPGHFDGVLSVVMKLFNLIQPTKAYFGEKDFQQLCLIEGMIQAFFMDVQIVRVPTLRESSGLAMSSRNVRLTPEEKTLAPQLHKSMLLAKSSEEAQKQLQQLGFHVDYVVDIEGRRYAAAKLGNVRLIDNVKI